MTSTVHGADVEQLRRTAQAMCDTAEELTATSLRIYGALFSLTWNGQDAMRARMAWDNEYGPRLLVAARALIEAGQHLLAEAEQQELASAGAGAAGQAPTSAPGAVQASVRSTLAQELFSMRALLRMLTPSEQTIDRARSAISSANGLLDFNTVITRLKIPTVVAGPLTAAGLVNDAATFREARQAGDLDGQLRSGGAVGATTVGLVPGGKVAGVLVGGAWEAPWLFRDHVFTGSRWEENFVERNEAIADTIGPMAVSVGLGTLIVSGVETGWEKLSEIYRPETTDGDEGSAGGGR